MRTYDWIGHGKWIIIRGIGRYHTIESMCETRTSIQGIEFLEEDYTS
jgi:hypothetical protein